VSDQKNLEPFLNKDYRDAWLDIRVKAGIAYQIQAIRQALGMSQAEFGALLSKPQSVVSRLEDNEYSGTVKTLLEVAKSLGVGLKVQFCSYPEMLAVDVSPAKLAVENIDASVALARDDNEIAPSMTVYSAARPYVTTANTGGQSPWLTTLPNQPPCFLAFGTHSTGKSIQISV